MIRSELTRRGFTRVDLSVLLVILVAAVTLLLPACNRVKTTEQETESKNNLKQIGFGNQQLSAVGKVREAAARSESQNKLKQMGLGLHGMVSASDAPMPPASGMYPLGGPNGTIFFHILPYLEQETVYRTYLANPVAGPIGAVVTIKTYCAPADPTNPGINTNLTSYAANAWLFGSNAGTANAPASGTARLSTLTNSKGMSNTVMFMERYARPGYEASGFIGHTWADNGRSAPNNHPWVYLPQFTTPTTPLPLNTSKVEGPVFGVEAADITAALDGTAHAFNGRTLQVGLADGSAKTITESVNTILSTGGTQTVWRWSVAASGATSQLPTPAGW